MATHLPYNFHYGDRIPQNGLQNAVVKLVPFDPIQHGEEYFRGTSDNPQVYDRLPMGPFSSTEEFIRTLLLDRIHPDPGCMLFAILDRRVQRETTSTNESLNTNEQQNGCLAGIIGFLRTDPSHFSTEMGFVITIPAFLRKGIQTSAIALLLNFSLSLPDQGGLGLRRVCWMADETNVASITLAKRMGFQQEGILRWHYAMAPTDGRKGNGTPVRQGDPAPHLIGRHSAILSICWDDWVNGGVQDLVAKFLN